MRAATGDGPKHDNTMPTGTPAKEEQRKRTALLVFPADRGHFAPCLPIAAHLRRRRRNGGSSSGSDFARWSSGATGCAWIGSRISKKDRTTPPCSPRSTRRRSGDGRGLNAENFDDEDGGDAFSAFMAEFAAGRPLQGMEALRRRLLAKSPPVSVVIYEANWFGGNQNVPGICDATNTPQVGILPTFVRCFRAHFKTKCHGLDDGGECCRVRDRQHDVDFGDSQHAKRWVTILASCLRQGVEVPKLADGTGRCVAGALVPPSSPKPLLSSSLFLNSWLAGSAKQHHERVPSTNDVTPDTTTTTTTTTLVVLGSQSQLATLSPWAREELVLGCLDASPRVVCQGSVPADLPAAAAAARPAIRRAIDDDRLLFLPGPHLPQWQLLHHPSVRCFVSHCGANSSHEAILAGVAVVPLPFFDDQYYIAAQFEQHVYDYPGRARRRRRRQQSDAAGRSFDYTPLRKTHLRQDRHLARERVKVAVELALSVEDELLQRVRQETLNERGVEQIGQFVLKTIQEHGSSSQTPVSLTS